MDDDEDMVYLPLSMQIRPHRCNIESGGYEVLSYRPQIYASCNPELRSQLLYSEEYDLVNKTTYKQRINYIVNRCIFYDFEV